MVSRTLGPIPSDPRKVQFPIDEPVAASVMTMRYNGPANDVTANVDSLVGNVLRAGSSQVEYAWDEGEELANRITVSIRQG